MTAIIAQHYRDNYEALSKEPTIIMMALDTIEKKMPFKLCFDGTDEPTHEFMMAARSGYQRSRDAGEATVEAESIGAAAEAVLIARGRILDAMAKVASK